ncbi:MAG: hypothetical protein Q8N18_21685 [Opitutaceae bacterium]|nr:hypothetical protein [Opitutaceae bacterium]
MLTMLNHEFLTADRSVQRTTFPSGKKVTANFSERTQTVGATAIPAGSFVVTKS